MKSMCWFTMSLILLGFSLSSYGDNESKIYQGSGTEYDQDESKSPYAVEIKITEGVSGRDKYLTIQSHVILEDGSYKGKTVKLSFTGPDSFVIIDADGDRLGWGHKIEFENGDAPKVHALMLNYRTSDKPDSNIVSHLLRFVEGSNTVTSTGSVIDADGKMVSAWSSESQE